VCAVHVQYFARDGVDTLLGFFAAFHGIEWTAWYLSTRVKIPILIRLRAIRHAQAQHETIRYRTNAFIEKRYQGGPPSNIERSE
jgi:hypothetical protein